MSPLAKVFVVLNLVLALGFLGVSATLFTTREQYVDTIAKIQDATEKTAKQSNEKIAQLMGENSTRRQNEQTLQAARQAAEAARDGLQSENGDLKKDVAAKDADIENYKTRIAQKDEHIGQKDQEIARLSETNERLIADSDKAKADKTRAEQLRARAYLDKEQITKQLTDLKIEYVSLQKDNDARVELIKAAEANGLDLASIVSVAPPPAIDGVVLAVRPDADLVILSVGSQDNVREGHEFTIYRQDRFIAKVKVIRITDDLAGARILYTESDASITVGDKASTRIGV